MVAKYPEYHKLWEDGTLKVVAIFGKYEVGGGANDAGVAAYNEFLGVIRSTYGWARESSPSANEKSFAFGIAGGGSVYVNVFLVDSVGSVSAAWDKRYIELTADADMVLYNGHAGLGANVAALSRKGKWFPGKYQIFFMNGCDTFAYFDNTLPSIRAALNPEDPSGTRYMDFITNAMPAYFNSLQEDSTALLRAAVNHTTPTTYQNIFKNMDRVQVVAVTGEEDNVFHPTYDPGTTWNGYEAYGGVAKAQTVTYQTEVLQPGTYVFTTTGDSEVSGGDADLRVRVGAPPTITSTYKCPSYQYNSSERCKVTITTPSVVHMAVTGDKDGVESQFVLRAYQIKP
jgi:hypothetical protein